MINAKSPEDAQRRARLLEEDRAKEVLSRL
jgi:hypothetical protein